MGAAIAGELTNVVIAGDMGATPRGRAISKRQRCELLRGQLTPERATFVAHWAELSRFILPRRARFVHTDTNKGDKRNSAIIDSTATEAAGTLSAGMMSGVTSPARPWFRLTLPDPDLAEQDDAKDWLFEVQRRMETVFLHSNLYKHLPILYGDIGVFGTSAMAVMEDDESVIRCYDFPVGRFLIANDHKLRVRTFVDVFSLSVQQMVERWGDVDESGRANFQRGEPTTLSLAVQRMYASGNRVAWIPIVHVVQPNISYDGAKIEAKYKKYEDLYYELGTASANQSDVNQYGLLEHGGFDEFPILVARWEVSGEDVYATNCPGMKALGDVKQLQTGEKRSAQAIEKSISPPLTGPSRLMNVKVSVLPGDVTYDDVRDGQLGIRPIYQFDFAKGIQELEAKQQTVRLRIQRVFKEDLFLMLSQSDRREITAREIDERHEEKLLALGPVLEQLNQDVLDPLIDRVFAIMLRKGLIPPAPESIQGEPLRVEYVSIMAQAQKQVGLAGLERFSSFVAQIAQTAPDIVDNVDDTELVAQYADATGVPPKILRHADQVAQIRDQRAQQQRAQQMAENAPKMAGAAQSLSQTPTGQNPALGGSDSALQALLAKSTARKTIGATQQPPQPVLAP